MGDFDKTLINNTQLGTHYPMPNKQQVKILKNWSKIIEKIVLSHCSTCTCILDKAPLCAKILTTQALPVVSLTD